MDIKWKKSSKLVGMLSRFLCIFCLLLSLMFWLPVLALSDQFEWDAIKDNDSQKTEAFRESITGYVNEFFENWLELEMEYANLARIQSANIRENERLIQTESEELYPYFDTDFFISNMLYSGAVTIDKIQLQYGVDNSSQTDVAVASAPDATMISAEESTSAVIVQDTNGEYYITQNKGFENFDLLYEFSQSIQDNRNVLYSVGMDNQVLYTNEPSLGFYGEGFEVPQGYEFLLYYDGNEIQIIKDGNSQEIYGDGIYRQGDWHLPGYANYQMLEEWKNVQFTLVAINEPQVIPEWTNPDFGDWRAEYLRIDRLHQQLRLQIINAVAAVVLFLLAILFRKSGREGNLMLASWTKKVWLEPKLLMLAFVTYFSAITLTGWLDRFFNRFDPDSIILLEYYVGSVFIYLPLFVFWLLINEIHYEKENWKNSIFYFLWNAFSRSELKQPFGRRLLIQNGIIFLLQWCLISAFYLFLLLLYTGRMSLSRHGKGISILLFFACCLASLLQLRFFYRQKKMAEGVEGLAEQIRTIHDDALIVELNLSEESGLKETGEFLNDIGTGMDEALEEKVKSERMKVELITNVSHDIKTPLTSIISYVELMKQEELPEHVKEYVQIIDHKSKRLKTMVQDVFEVSKAASGQLPVTIKQLDLSKLLQQTLADMQEQLEEAPVIVKTEIPDPPVLIEADGDRLYRVYQNLIQNAINYSLDGSRIYIQLIITNETAVTSIKNISREELTQDIDYTERFVRGDQSRTDTGSGLGLSIAKGFAEACGGTMKVEVISDLFIVTITYPLSPNTP